MIIDRELPKRQHCPACNRYVKPSTRYRSYACHRCKEKATDKKGRLISFYNITMDGHGCQGVLVESGKLTRDKTCYIKDREYSAEEGYFGGIVLRPLPARPAKRKRNPASDTIGK